MTKEDRDMIDKLKNLAIAMAERVCQIEMCIAAGQPIPYSMVQNSSLMARAFATDLEQLLMTHGAKGSSK